jgi:hypothetical protein
MQRIPRFVLVSVPDAFGLKRTERIGTSSQQTADRHRRSCKEGSSAPFLTGILMPFRIR